MSLHLFCIFPLLPIDLYFMHLAFLCLVHRVIERQRALEQQWIVYRMCFSLFIWWTLSYVFRCFCSYCQCILNALHIASFYSSSSFWPDLSKWNRSFHWVQFTLYLDFWTRALYFVTVLRCIENSTQQL